MREITADDFRKAKRNPFFEKLNRRVEVGVRHENYSIYEELAKQKGVKPETIMQQCLNEYAKILKEHD